MCNLNYDNGFWFQMLARKNILHDLESKLQKRSQNYTLANYWEVLMKLLAGGMHQRFGNSKYLSNYWQYSLDKFPTCKLYQILLFQFNKTK